MAQNPSPDSTSSINYDEIHHAKHHQQHIENLEKLKPTPSQFEKVSMMASGHFSSIRRLTERRSSILHRRLLLLATCAGHSATRLPLPSVASFLPTRLQRSISSDGEELEVVRAMLRQGQVPTFFWEQCSCTPVVLVNGFWYIRRVLNRWECGRLTH